MEKNSWTIVKNSKLVLSYVAIKDLHRIQTLYEKSITNITAVFNFGKKVEFLSEKTAKVLNVGKEKIYTHLSNNDYFDYDTSHDIQSFVVYEKLKQSESKNAIKILFSEKISPYGDSYTFNGNDYINIQVNQSFNAMSNYYKKYGFNLLI